VTLSEKRELIDELAQDYLYEKENNVVWRRENSFSYGVALGKLFGACKAFGFEIDETEEWLLIKNGSRTLLEYKN
jgi:hypothetical protein